MASSLCMLVSYSYYIAQPIHTAVADRTSVRKKVSPVARRAEQRRKPARAHRGGAALRRWELAAAGPEPRWLCTQPAAARSPRDPPAFGKSTDTVRAAQMRILRILRRFLLPPRCMRRPRACVCVGDVHERMTGHRGEAARARVLRFCTYGVRTDGRMLITLMDLWIYPTLYFRRP